MNQIAFLMHHRTPEEGGPMTITRLAREAGVGRAHLSQVLHNVPGRGGHTRRKIAPRLTTAERLLLGWDNTGKRCQSST